MGRSCLGALREKPHGELASETRPIFNHLNSLFNAATAKAFTTVFAGFALTTTSLPNIIFFPALVAGFFLVLIMQRPGSTNLPLDFTSVVPTSARLSSSFEQTDLFKSCCVASASAIPPFDSFPVRLFIAFIAFIAFIGAIGQQRGQGAQARLSAPHDFGL